MALEKLKVRMLLRVSSKQQLDADGDISVQRSIVKNYIDKQSTWELDSQKPEYCEAAVSGYSNSVNERVALQEIREDAKNNCFQILVCYKSDRVGRREYEIPQYISELARYGVFVYTVTEGRITPETHEEELTSIIRFWAAQGASMATGQRVRDAGIENVKRGKNQGGNAPYGYRLEYSEELSKHGRMLKKKVIAPEQAEIVKKIYSLSKTKGIGPLKIAKILNGDDTIRRLSPNGETWYAGTVRDILRNPIYTGYITYMRRTKTGEKYKSLSPDEWIMSETCNEDLKIMDISFWNEVQRLNRERAKHYSKGEKNSDDRGSASTGKLPLLDVIHCGYCGGKMSNGSKYNYWKTKSGEKRKSMVGYYRCQTLHQGGDCKGVSSYRADNIEPIVFDVIKDYLGTLEDNQSVVDKILKAQNEQKLQNKKLLKEAEKNIKNLEKDIATLREELPKAIRGQYVIPIEELYKLITENEKKLQDKRDMYEKMQLEMKENKDYEIETEKFIQKIPQWKVALENGDYAEKRTLINTLVKCVDVKKDEVIVQMKINLDEFLSRKKVSDGTTLYTRDLV